ncbi:unnamed protein product [Mytilus edulis]|uniref:Uncharacterized protein n=1 Tax=Mytilus edulis TaxID=6550 RepID=A0A8S3RQZ2_MYTED|nr:unnamed protein product [Mytilus edulis]
MSRSHISQQLHLPQIQPYFTATPQPAAVQVTSLSNQPLPVISTPSSMVQPSSQTTQPLPVTISTSSLWQPYLAETAAPQLTAGQSTPQLAQQVPVPTNPSTMERNEITTSDHSKISEAPSSPPPIVEGYDPEMPWIDGDKRRVEFREEIELYPPRRIQMTATGRGRLYDWSHLGVPTQETLNDPRLQLCCPPPSSYLSGEDAELIRRIRSRARTAEIDARVVPDGYLGLLKEEKAVLPDGTVYVLKSTWIPDPSVRRRRNTATQTEQDTNQVDAIIENGEIGDNGVQATVTTEDTSTQCNILQELLLVYNNCIKEIIFSL